MSTFNVFPFLLLVGFLLSCESHHVSSEPTGTAANKVPSEQAAVPLKGYTRAQIKASIDGKFKSPQGEAPPEHEGARTANVCKGEPDGDYIDAHNPYGYITCLGGQTYRKNCAPGTMWNNSKKRCVWQLK